MALSARSSCSNLPTAMPGSSSVLPETKQQIWTGQTCLPCASLWEQGLRRGPGSTGDGGGAEQKASWLKASTPPARAFPGERQGRLRGPAGVGTSLQHDRSAWCVRLPSPLPGGGGRADANAHPAHLGIFSGHGSWVFSSRVALLLEAVHYPSLAEISEVSEAAKLPLCYFETVPPRAVAVGS